MDDDDAEMSGPEVADELGVERTTVWRIPHDVLPYRRTPGNHRVYLKTDVEAYRDGRERPPAPPPPPSLEQRVSDLEAWRQAHEDDHP